MPQAKHQALSIKDSITLAVVSDLHAYEDDGHLADGAPSHYCITKPSDDPGRNPIAGLKKLINSNNLRANALICPGDLGDRAVPAAVEHAWKTLHEIRGTLKATKLLATTGNHDIDSRYKHNHYDAKGFLQSLSPPYPLGQVSFNDKYWSRHFAVLTIGLSRLLILNSSAFHGDGRADITSPLEYEHGRISPYTLAAIKQTLGASQPADLNILVCHHHPHPHSELNLGEDDLMKGGHELLELLKTGTYGHWLVLHGHKHHPKLERAAGGAKAPWIFCAGSLCAHLPTELQTVARNQFYLLSFTRADLKQHGLVGQFRAWDWHVGQGWVPARPGSGLPADGGFGWQGSIPSLARSIEPHVASGAMPSKWKALITALPELRFVAPCDLETLIDELRISHNIQCEPDGQLPPTLLGRTS